MNAKVSQAEFARMHTVSRQAVNDLVSRGIIQLDENGKLDPISALEEIQKKTNPAKSKIVGVSVLKNEDPADNKINREDEAILSYHEARTQRERFEAKIVELTYHEKKGILVNVTQLESELMQMVGAFRSELLSRDDKLKDALDTLYGIEIDLTLLNEHTYAALSQLARYDASGQGAAAPIEGEHSAAGEDEHAGMGASLPEDVG